MNNCQFIHLKVRSHYSILEGSIKIKDIIAEAKKNKMPAVALTDNSNLFGAMEFTKACIENGIQPILGAILTVGEINKNNKVRLINKIKVTLLVQNLKGWKNLSYLVSRGYKTYKDYNINFITLRELNDFNKGLICLLSDYDKSEVINKNTKFNLLEIESLKEAFSDRLYIEIFRNLSKTANKKEADLLRLSSEFDIPLACSNDVFFLNQEIYEAHDCFSCIAQGTTIENANRIKVNKESYFKSSESMVNIFIDKPEAITNTINIAKRCSFILKDKVPNLPKIYQDNQKDENIAINQIATKGLLSCLNLDNFEKDNFYLEYKKRLDFELKVIASMGYSGYFLIVSDFIKWAKKNSIPVGPGRGSGAGSIVAWALNITNLDPIKYGLLFERFLNPERVSLPDFDIDFCTIRRDEVIAYVREKYGKDKVAQIITFGSLQPKAVIRDIGRVLGINYGVVDKLSKTIPNIIPVNTNLAEIFKTNIAMQNMINGNEELEKLYDISLQLEGLNRNASTHAAGIVISNSPIIEDVPLYYDLNSDIPATQFSMKYLEKIGLIKFDFLGVETLTMLNNIIKLIKDRDIEVDLDNISLNDTLTYKNLSLGRTLGIFQLESIPMRQVLKELKPDRLEDIIAVVALYRPGPMENIPDYIKRKHNNDLTVYQHPLLEKVLKETHGIMIYQEQVMEAARVLAGFSLAKADLLRRAIGKKIKSEMNDLKESFVNGCLKKNIKRSDSLRIFKDIEKFAGYGFNKSHAAAYALISYQTAWCKSNYPVEFFTALLNSEAGKKGDKLIYIWNELSRLKIKVLPSNINKSMIGFSVQRYKGQLCIRSGLSNIKNIGAELSKFIVSERKKSGEYKSLINFFSRIDDKLINKRQVEFFAMAGVFDEIYEIRSIVYNSASNLVLIAQNFQKDRESNQQILFNSDINESYTEGILEKSLNWSSSLVLINEFLALGFFISENPLIKQREYFKKFKLSNSMSIEDNKVNGKLFDILGFLIKTDDRITNNKKALELTFIDEWGVFSILTFDEENLNIKIGKAYILNLMHSVDRENRMRIRLKSIRDTESFIEKTSNSIKITLKHLKNILDLKKKIDAIKQGKNKIILVYNGYEVDTGIKVNYSSISFNELKLLEGIQSVNEHR